MREFGWFVFAVLCLVMSGADKPHEVYWLLACVQFTIGSGIIAEIKKAARK